MKCPHCHNSLEISQGDFFGETEPTTFEGGPNYAGAKTGMTQAEIAANEEWKAQARNALYYTAWTNEVLTVDAVSQNIPNGVKTHNYKALGGIMMGGKKEGWIEVTDRFTPSTRSTRHATPIRIWKSLIWIGTVQDL